MSDSIRHFINLANGIINKEMPPVGPDQESVKEVDLGKPVTGSDNHIMGSEGHSTDLLKRVADQIAKDHADQDYTAIDELFKRTPSKELESFLSEFGESIQEKKKNCGCNQDPCITYGKQNEAIEEGACTYANPLMAGKTYTCCDCGDEMHVPQTDCQHDSHDETGSWWRDQNGNGVPDLFESYKAKVNTLLKG